MKFFVIGGLIMDEEIITELFKTFEGVISILDKMSDDIRFIKDRQDEIYIASLGLVNRERKNDPIGKILLRLENSEITANEARREIAKIKNK